jgi:hypothetical protein
MSITLSQLQESATGIAMQESVDRALLSPFINPNLTSTSPILLQWTSMGFPNVFPILSFTLTPPPICADGISRNFYEYISYLLGVDISVQTQNYGSIFEGIICGYTIAGNTLSICISKG